MSAYDYTPTSATNPAADLSQEYHADPPPSATDPTYKFYPEVEQETIFGPILAPSIYGKYLDSLQIAADGNVVVKPDSREDSFLEFNNVAEAMVITSYADANKTKANIQIASANVDIDAGAAVTIDATTSMALTAAGGAMDIKANNIIMAPHNNSNGVLTITQTNDANEFDADGSNVTITNGNKTIFIGDSVSNTSLAVAGGMQFIGDVTVGQSGAPKTLKVYGDIDLSGVINTLDVNVTALTIQDHTIKLASSADGSDETTGVTDDTTLRAAPPGIVIDSIPVDSAGILTYTASNWQKHIVWKPPSIDDLKDEASNVGYAGIHAVGDEAAWEIEGGAIQLKSANITYSMRISDTGALQFWKKDSIGWKAVATFGNSVNADANTASAAPPPPPAP